MKKDSFVRDALVLTLITLVAGFLLGGAYGMTKDRIEEINNKSTMEAYAQVIPADSYDDEAYADALKQATDDGTIAANHAGTKFYSVVAAKDASGNEIGYIVKASNAGYGGDDIVVVGVSPDLKITGISFPEALPETAGLGQKATEPAFYEQFAGKGMNLSVKKGGGAGEDEIDAISGATITSTAVTNSVNASTEFVQDYILNKK